MLFEAALRETMQNKGKRDLVNIFERVCFIKLRNFV